MRLCDRGLLERVASGTFIERTANDYRYLGALAARS